MLQTLAAVLLIVGLGGLLLGAVWGILALGSKVSVLTKVWQPVAVGAGLVATGWAIPAPSVPPDEPPGFPAPGPVGPIPAGALIQPVAMVATHTRRAYAIDAGGRLSLWGEPIPDPNAGQGVVSRIAVGREHLCVLRPEGRVQCWGEQREGQASPPGGTYVAIAAGTEHTCALRPDGTPVCWGRQDSRVRPPEGLRLRSISASARHTCGLDEIGAAHCWGCEAGSAAACRAPETPFLQVSAGHHHSCGLQLDLGIQCWGDNSAGQSASPTGTFTAVAAGWTQTCGLNTEGFIGCWGCQGPLQALDPTQASHCKPPSGRFSALSAGDIWGSCAIRDRDGTPTCWGGPARTDEPR